MSLELSLYQIESDLANLIEMREEATVTVEVATAAQWDDLAEKREELAVIDHQIREYLAAEIRKVDGIRAFWRHAELMRDAAKAEAAAQRGRAKTWEDRLAHLKAMCQTVMEAIPFPAGKPKKLEGRTGALYLKGNGGRPAVTVTDESLVPDNLCTVTVTMPMSEWTMLIGGGYYPPSVTVRPQRVPSLSLIAEAMRKPCGECGGSGVLNADEHGHDHCEACGTTGRSSVPGCRLAPKGSHVECR